MEVEDKNSLKKRPSNVNGKGDLVVKRASRTFLKIKRNDKQTCHSDVVTPSLMNASCHERCMLHIVHCVIRVVELSFSIAQS